MSDKQSKVIRQTATEEVWHFCCEACGAEGELTLQKADGMKSFGCPEGCGATYVPCRTVGRKLICVVLPFFRVPTPAETLEATAEAVRRDRP